MIVFGFLEEGESFFNLELIYLVPGCCSLSIFNGKEVLISVQEPRGPRRPWCKDGCHFVKCQQGAPRSRDHTDCLSGRLTIKVPYVSL